MDLLPAVSTAACNANNQLTNWNGAALSYDANGNMTSNGVHSFVWNARNQLASLNGSSFQYDAFGRRTMNATGTGFLYDGFNSVQELSGSTVTANILTGGVDENFLRSDAGGSWNFLSDALGSTLGLTDTTGAVQTQYTYDPFGNTTTTGVSTSNLAQYTGRENDGTGLYYYRARYYDPSIGRFIGEDPIGFSGGSNFYRYVGNDPIDYRDPLGLWRFPDFIAVNVNAGTIIGWSGTASLDRYGNVYWSPIGLGVGKSVTTVSASVTVNWMNQKCKPSERKLHDMLTTHGFNFAAGFFGGVSESWTPGTGTATGFGFVSPQVGVSYNYSFPGTGKVGSGW